MPTDLTAPPALDPRAGGDDFRTLFELLPIGAYRSSVEGRQLRANAALVRLNGYASEAELLAGVADIGAEWYVLPGRRQQFRDLLERDGRVTGFVSEVYRHKTRERIWVSENAHAVHDALGRIVCYEGTVEEITDRVRTEAALQRSEAHLRQIADHVPCMLYRGHYRAGQPLRYSFVSRGIRDIYGVEPEVLMADPLALRRFRHPDDAAGIDDVVQAAVDAGSPLSLELRIRLDDGTVKWLQVSSSAAWSEGDEQVRVGVILDVSAQRRAEAALREQDARWKLALDVTGDGVWDWNMATGEEVLTRRCKEMYGYDDDELPKGIEALDRLTHPDDVPQMLLDRRNHFEGRTPVYVNEHRIRCKDGSWKWVLSRGMIIARDAQGRPLRMIGTHTDISERRQAEALRGERDRAAAAQRAMSDFMSKVSHELRTPLNAILGFGQLLETERSLPPRPAAWVHELMASGRHLLALVDDILDLSGAQSGLMRFDRRPVPIAPVIEECRAMLAMQAAARELRWTLDVDPALAADADRRRLKQVLSNLLSNAIKYNHAGGEVGVAARRRDRLVEIAISDTGPGLDDGQQARLFRPFERLGAERGGVAGTGLGLALSRQLVIGMDGEIEVHSRPGAGATFTVRLPAADLPHGPAPLAPPAASART